MRKQKFFLLPLALALSVLVIFSCDKGKLIEEKSEKENKEITQSKKDSSGANMANKYAGPCPYECDDPRCVNYSEPNPDCGGGGTPEPDERICGSEFAKYNLAGTTFSNAVDSIGKWHNDAQIFLLKKMQEKDVNLYTDTLQSFLKNTTNSFFASKGITHQNTSIPNLDISDTTWNFSSLSYGATSILNQLKYLVYNYSETQHSNFIAQCSSLKWAALELQSDQEALSVGASVSVAINSFTYWKNNLASWQQYLLNIPDSNTLARAVPCNISLKQIGGADIVGAVKGAIGGGIGAGPAGAVAGGLLVSSAASSINILAQAAQCVPGVVGQVSRWLADWF